MVKTRAASLKKTQVDLERTTIYAPIDGLVISRLVDVGQTVAASFNAPTLFSIANDLSKYFCIIPAMFAVTYPMLGRINKADFEGFDAVIHLAGGGIADRRWTKKRKEQLFLSRCRDTWLLSQVLCRLYRPPKTMICASAIGFYGNRGDEELTEESGPGTGFLADLCQKWEEATLAIDNRGTRVVHCRFGAVLGTKGGALKKLLTPYRLGLGGKLGSGNQFFSWIAIDDLVGAAYHCLMNDTLSGPVNFVAPQAVRQREFAKLLAKKLGRPAFCRVPAPLLKLILGEMAEEMLLSSQRVVPKKLLALGYRFRYPDLKAALDHLL